MTDPTPIPLFKVLMDPRAPDAVREVLLSGYTGEGQAVADFETALQRTYGRPYLTMHSCTAALEVAFDLCDVKSGDHVATTPATCTASNTGLVIRGAVPLWCDVDPITGLIDPNDVRKRILRRPDRVKAIIAVDWAGRLCDYDALESIGAEYGIPVIQDAAHRGPGPMRSPAYSTLSFQAIKFLNCGGDGGALAVPDTTKHTEARLQRWYGLDRTSSASMRCAQNIGPIRAGRKAHMNNVAASIGLANLVQAVEAVVRTQENARYYDEALRGLPNLVLPPPDPSCHYWLYTVLVRDRDGFIKFLGERGIESSPAHLRNDKHDAFYFPSGQLIGVDYFDSRQTSIPVGWWVTEQDRKRIVEAVAAWCRR